MHETLRIAVPLGRRQPGIGGAMAALTIRRYLPRGAMQSRRIPGSFAPRRIQLLVNRSDVRFAAFPDLRVGRAKAADADRALINQSPSGVWSDIASSASNHS